MIAEMTDNSLMPFGQHKGKRMGDISAVYLLYIYEKGWVWHEGVKKYIADNMQGLKQEVKNIPKR